MNDQELEKKQRELDIEHKRLLIKDHKTPFWKKPIIIAAYLTIVISCIGLFLNNKYNDPKKRNSTENVPPISRKVCSDITGVDGYCDKSYVWLNPNKPIDVFFNLPEEVKDLNAKDVSAVLIANDKKLNSIEKEFEPQITINDGKIRVQSKYSGKAFNGAINIIVNTR